MVAAALSKDGRSAKSTFRSTVLGVYKMGHRAREMVAEAQEQVQDIVAEIHAEDDTGTAGTKGATAG